jgi:hypothetical protein
MAIHSVKRIAVIADIARHRRNRENKISPLTNTDNSDQERIEKFKTPTEALRHGEEERLPEICLQALFNFGNSGDFGNSGNLFLIRVYPR